MELEVNYPSESHEAIRLAKKRILINQSPMMHICSVRIGGSSKWREKCRC